MTSPSEESELQTRISDVEPKLEIEPSQEEPSASVDDSIQSNGAIEAKSEPASLGEEGEVPKHEQSESGSTYARSDAVAEESLAIVEEIVDLKLPEPEADTGASVEDADQPELKKEEGNRTFTMRDLLSGLKSDQGQGSNEASSADGKSVDSPSSLQKRQILYPDTATAQLINSVTGVDDQGRPRQRILAFAAKRFATAIERNPGDYDALYNWALILQESADSVEPDSTSPSKDALLEEACKRYEEATHLCPTLHDAYYNWAIAISDRARLRGRTKEAEEMWKQATKYYEKAVQLNWNSPQALNNWGLALQELSAIVPAKEKLTIVRTAISKFRAAIRLQFDFHRAIYNLGTVLYALAEDMFRVGGSSNATEASSEYLYSQCSIYIAAAYALKPNNSVYRSALRLVRSMLPLPYLKVGYLTAPPPGKTISAHNEWKRTQFILNHEGLFQLIADDQNQKQTQMSLSGKSNTPATGRRQPIKVEIPDIISISPCSDLTLPPGAGLFIDTIHGPVYLVADSWESLDGWLDAIRLVYTIFAKEMEAVAVASTKCLPSLSRPMRSRRTAVVMAAIKRSNSYGSGRLVDESLIVLRKRIHEMKVIERNYQPPSHWMDWEKQIYANYDDIICRSIGAVQSQLIDARPSVAIAALGLVAASVPTSVILLTMQIASVLASASGH